MEEPLHTACRNCGEEMPADANFCPQCGQRNTDGRISLVELLQVFVANIFNLDNRIFRTLGTLAVPGKLTEEYFKGRHVPFYHPVRLFIVSAGLFTAMLTLFMSKSGLQDAKFGLDSEREAYIQHKHYRQLDTVSAQVKALYGNPVVDEAMDTLKALYVIKPKTKMTINTTVKVGDEERDTVVTFDKTPFMLSKRDSITVTGPAGSKVSKIAVEDVMNLKEDALLEKYGVEGFLDRLIVRQFIRITKGGPKFFFYLIGNTIWLTLIMMPMLALVLKLLYIRQGYFYYEHLVFSFHTHTFVFLLFALLLGFGKDLPEFIPQGILLGIAVYLFFAMKRFYRQGWAKTFVKFSIANSAYFFVFIAAMLLTALASVALF